ncbi:ATP-dependent zinc metalloprotease FtsH [Holdemania massiliensis]|uniref:ATP-dependent zinc metalloprotease FtsH n=1 Tax=Holdemania massiliensis TaxID=1468449 RepID=A0A6N7S7I5_9FIRM|nr:ATP-dependent zinc metalloprotease FtsH [Holdemania massiliensis]MSA71510.1 ATP-dependent zinc metalloprotease FtsH [Holdemania massiliensis]MSA89759.1 ATP-dependent zinc metalloprotease FtsH [Holdemania massiliensis]MSB78590.1 ATP-dependent zinc metalloprotease FtsH [Holdemania massiliensis]MSC33514.1 ATP-dependent zinc metalloprotease FtsH [Holdemania massiliensis]MSC39905.1 ATP-dependent zinc metalloprotease FtsH [Holdemania massiliensis]
MRNNRWINFVPYLIVILALFSLMNMNTGTATQNLTYNEFQKLVEEQKVTESALTVGDNVIKIKGVFEQDGKKVGFTASVPRSETEVDALMSALKAADVKVSDMNESNLFLDTIMSLIPFVIFGAMAFFLITKMNGGGNNKAFEFSKSRARLEGNIKVRFEDVAGCDEEKQEMAEIIDYLKSPKKFAKMGARIPKGILMVGSPGTGKTLLAKAVAGEADVPFYSISGSDFVEMFVGVGASRVRDMFKKAQQTAPCMIFIDEIDAVGRQRGAGLGGGHDEREQTLNQLLVEMDGITDNAGIVVIAATNRPDVLDPALLRPGRFDRQITVSLPDRRGRKAILEVHARNKKLAPEIDLDALAKRTPGFSGADLENVLNEAAILAVRENSDLIHMHNLDEAIDRVMMGPAKKSRKYDEKSKKLVAYHESGHAIVGLNLENSNIVQKVTIIPRGTAGGYNLMTPKEEKIMNTKNDLMSAITGYMGGRVAEEVFFDDITTGAVNDIEQATKLARDMVTLYGMSDLGPVQYDHGQQNVFLGRDYNSASNVSGQVAFEIDQEIRKIIDQCHDEAKKIILEHKEELIKIAEALIENETLTAEQIDKIIKGEPFLDLPAAPEVKSKSEETVETETIVTEITENSQTETEAE